MAACTVGQEPFTYSWWSQATGAPVAVAFHDGADFLSAVTAAMLDPGAYEWAPGAPVIALLVPPDPAAVDSSGNPAPAVSVLGEAWGFSQDQVVTATRVCTGDYVAPDTGGGSAGTSFESAAVLVSALLLAWAVGYVLGWKTRQIMRALSAS